MVLIKVKLNHKKYVYIYIFTHTHAYIYTYPNIKIYIYIYIYTYIYSYIFGHNHIHTYINIYILLILPKNNSNNVNQKCENSNSNEGAWSYCLKEILLVVYKFYIICMNIQRVPNTLFLSKRCLIVSIPLVLNPAFSGLKTIMIQHCDIQGSLYIFQKYRFCEDCL